MVRAISSVNIGVYAGKNGDNWVRVRVRVRLGVGVGVRDPGGAAELDVCVYA